MSQTQLAPRERSLVLPLIAVCLLALLPLHAAGLLDRLQAMAQPPKDQTAGGQTPPKMSPPSLAAPTPPPQVPARQPDGKLLEELTRRSAELDRREHDLETWAAQVAVAERTARTELAELARLRSQIEKVVAEETAASDADLGVLVGLYSNMKPTQAAAVLAKLSASKAAAILEKLDIHSAGPTLAAMDPDIAMAITEELTHRHAAFRP